MTKNMAKLVEDAKQAGYQIATPNGAVRITRTVKVNKTATRTTGLHIYEDGTAFAVDVDLSIAKGLRSYKSMRSALGL